MKWVYLADLGWLKHQSVCILVLKKLLYPSREPHCPDDQEAIPRDGQIKEDACKHDGFNW